MIKASSQRQIDTLVGDLASDQGPVRDAAVARLMVLGARAVGRLIDVVGTRANAPAARAAAFRALEGIGDPRALEAALAGVGDPDAAVATAAIGAARAFFDGPRGIDAVARLTTTALDRTRPASVRLVAANALGNLARATVAPVFAALETDPDPALAALGAAHRDRRRPGKRAASGPLDVEALDDPDDLRRRLLSDAGASLPLAALHRLVQQIREREAREDPAGRTAWTTARGAAHQALAARGSTVALYDLKESLEAADAPLPVEFLTAVASIGDASCLQSLAAAYSRSAGRRDAGWWPRHLSDAFRTIVKRGKVTRRNAAMKKIERRWPEILAGAAERRAGNRNSGLRRATPSKA